MSEKVVKSKTCLEWCWSPPAEDIEGIVRVQLPHETQQKLYCIVGKQVFLEYPWAFVMQKDAFAQACQVGSGLEAFKDNINNCQTEHILIGYACQHKLISLDFVICLTNSAKAYILKRNKAVTQKIYSKVHRLITIEANYTINSKVYDNNTIQEVLESMEVFHDDCGNSKSRFEVEVDCTSQNIDRPRRKLTDRNSDEARDGYVELTSSTDSFKFESIRMKRVSRSVSTTFPPQDKSIQLTIDYPNNKWTQSHNETDKKDCIIQTNDIIDVSLQQEQPPNISVDTSDQYNQKSDMNDINKIPHFSEETIAEMIDIINYNASINVYSDDIENLVSDEANNVCAFNTHTSEYYYIFDNSNYLINPQNVIKSEQNKMINVAAISDVSWHPSIFGLVAISYVGSDYSFDLAKIQVNQQLVTRPKLLGKSNNLLLDKNITKNNNMILIWSLSLDFTSTYPLLFLDDFRQVVVVSFCPSSLNNIIIGGCTNGQLLLWDLDQGNLLKKKMKQNIKNMNYKTEMGVISCSISSYQLRSHLSTIRAIHWHIPKFVVENNKEINKNNIGSNFENTLKFLTSAEEGIIIIWNLFQQFVKNNTDNNNQKQKQYQYEFHPFHKFNLQSLGNDFFNLTVLSSFLCRIVLDINNSDFINENNDLALLWLGSTQGQLVIYTWQNKEIDVQDENYSSNQLFNRKKVADCVHDGPVTSLINSHHIPNIFLSIGGSTFAIWHVYDFDQPVIWKKCNSRYTTCCWTHTPGIFILATCYGDLEIWDIYRKMKQPIHIQTISLTGKSITGLVAFTHENLQQSMTNFIVGICHLNGTFRYMMLQVQHQHYTHQEEKNPNNLAQISKVNWFDRITWIEKFIERQVEWKNTFHTWQQNYLASDKRALDKKNKRIVNEVRRRQEEARIQFLKKQKAEKVMIKRGKHKSKFFEQNATSLIVDNVERMKSVMVEKKRYDFKEIDKLRHRLVQQERERRMKFEKVADKLMRRDDYYTRILATQFPESSSNQLTNNSSSTVHQNSNYSTVNSFNRITVDQVMLNKYMQDYLFIKKKAEIIINSNKNKSSNLR
ncbi:WD repeat-containing protein 63-like [Chelonus insularis]|uniref:WD repeat-containing protein 63-like n=1 Tax=Chelonus insularis TaxID=460826 RepID=UPI00158B9930|nr:WD repeat-containing protein 63-like [Chelonus insularis]